MLRFKGLEYQRMIIAGVSDGLVPRAEDQPVAQDSDPKRYQRERQRDRSLLFVAATRARDEPRRLLARHPQPVPASPAFLSSVPNESTLGKHGVITV